MSQLKPSEAIKVACDKGRRAFHGLFGIYDLQKESNPMTNLKLYKTVVLTSALYGCEMWNSMTLRDIQAL